MNTLQGLLDTPPELRSEEINKKISKFVKVYSMQDNNFNNN